jgi:hypothetical protein
MTEQLRHHDSGETLKLDVDVAKNLERAKEEASKSPELSDQIEQIRAAVQEKAVSGSEVNVVEQENRPPAHSFGTHKQLKHLSYRRTLASIQSRLKGPDKTFSRVIHKKLIERASNFGAVTIARPGGILGGGLAALAGSIFSLYLARRYGFHYNFSIFILLFVSGYVAGSLLELVLRLAKRRR